MHIDLAPCDLASIDLVHIGFETCFGPSTEGAGTKPSTQGAGTKTHLEFRHRVILCSHVHVTGRAQRLKSAIAAENAMASLLDRTFASPDDTMSAVPPSRLLSVQECLWGGGGASSHQSDAHLCHATPGQWMVGPLVLTVMYKTQT